MSEKKPWAVFVYLVADDQYGSTAPALDDIAESELDLMFEAADSQNMHLAVQADFRNKKRVWRYLRRQSDSNLAESSAADPKTVNRFLAWAHEKCPAERHLLLFWGHAFGTAGLFPDSRPDAPQSRDLLSLTELGNVLSAANVLFGYQPIDLVMFKNCCLSNLETAYQLRHSAELMIASQGRLPAQGWPYERLFSALMNDRSQNGTESIGRHLARHLAQHYLDNGSGADIPITLLRLKAAHQLARPMRTLTSSLLRVQSDPRTNYSSTVRECLRRAAHTGDPALPDVVNLCRFLRNPRAPYDRSLAEAAQTVEQFINRELVLSHWSRTSAFNGVGVFHDPVDQAARSDSIVASALDQSEYLKLAFSKDTLWSRLALQASATVSGS